MGTPTPANSILPSSPAPQSVLERSRTTGEEESGGRGSGMGGYENNGVKKDNNKNTQLSRRSCSDEIPAQGGKPVQEPHHVTVEETDLASPTPRVSTAFPSALTSTAVVAAAAAVSDKARKREPHLCAGDRRRKSSCPGLYCNSGGEGLEEGEQRTESTGTPPASELKSSGERCAKVHVAAGEGMAGAEHGQMAGTLAQAEQIALSGPERESTEVVGAGASPGAGEKDYPMFQLPLKVGWARWTALSSVNFCSTTTTCKILQLLHTYILEVYM